MKEGGEWKIHYHEKKELKDDYEKHKRVEIGETNTRRNDYERQRKKSNKKKCVKLMPRILQVEEKKAKKNADKFLRSQAVIALLNL